MLSADCAALDMELEKFRKEHFPRLAEKTYLDHAGATLYSDVQMSNYLKDLSENVYGNPHSHSVSSQRTSYAIERVRTRILQHFNTSAKHYQVIFTSNCTAALKLIADSFEFGPKQSVQASIESTKLSRTAVGLFAYLNDNHTSVVGMREVVAQRGAEFRCLTAGDVEKDLSICQSTDKEHDRDRIANEQIVNCNNLFAYPAQSNFSGERYPLQWISKFSGIKRTFAGHRGTWFVLLDAASYLTSSNLDLSLCQPDFVTLSFYKIFGFPTGLGALLVKNTSEGLLRKTYFGGGTVEVALSSERFHSNRKPLNERFEDGTLPFLEILAVSHGFQALESITANTRFLSDHTYQLAVVVYNHLKAMRHLNDQPLVVLYNNTRFSSSDVQGPIVTFNLLTSDGAFVRFTQVEKLAEMYNIDLRTGCFCNMGACQQHLGLTSMTVLDNFKAGHVCGDNLDLINGRPTGSIRVSFGAWSILKDAQRFIQFLKDCFLQQSAPPGETICSQNSDTGAETPSSVTEWNSSSHNNAQLTATLSFIYIYPIKSCGAVQVSASRICSRGLQYDRAWMIINAAGQCVSQKRINHMCVIVPKIDELNQQIILTAREFPDLPLPLSVTMDETTRASICTSRVCADRVRGIDCGEAAAVWCQTVLGRPDLRLIKQMPDDDRLIRGKVSNILNTDADDVSQDDELLLTKGEEDTVLPLANDAALSLANEAQYLLIGSASVNALLSIIRQKSDQLNDLDSMINFKELSGRFRSNLIVETHVAFEELNWKTIRIGNNVFLNQGACTRCQMICVDQSTGSRTKEPLRSLAAMSQAKGTFGILLRWMNTNVEASLSERSSTCPEKVGSLSNGVNFIKGIHTSQTITSDELNVGDIVHSLSFFKS